MNKRERMLSLLEDGKGPDCTPAAFFIHFDPEFHFGQPAVKKHLDYFRHTGMDFVKIQYERKFPPRPEIQRPKDWADMPFYNLDFYEGQLQAVEGLIKAAKKEALVILTLYSPFMCAAHTAGSETLTGHIRENPDQVKKGMEIITESLMMLVRRCIDLGLDGFYTSTQGGENSRLGNTEGFRSCIRPYDLALMQEIDRSCGFNILHICDFHGDYDDLTPFVDYPGHVVNYANEVGGNRVTGSEIARMFGRPVMGGLDRKGVIATGSEEEIKQAVAQILTDAPDRFVLGADCTLPGDIPWDNIRTAIAAAHGFDK